MSKKKKTSLKRRDFVKGVAAASAVAGLPSCVSSLKNKRQPDSVETEYDFIIVGTGAGGAPLAARLATYGYSVLCIEAGFEHTTKDGEDPTKVKVPAYHPMSSEAPEWSWNFFVRHNNSQQKNVLGKLNADLKVGFYIREPLRWVGVQLITP